MLLLYDPCEMDDVMLEKELASGGDVVVVKSLPELRAAAEKIGVELLVCHVGDIDMSLLETLRIFIQQYPLPVVVISVRLDRKQIVDAARAGVAMCVTRDMAAGNIALILEMARVRHDENGRHRREMHQMQVQLTERKLIERAKGIVMKQRGATEEEAYRALRRVAMNSNQRLYDIARGIVTAAELLG